MYPRDADQLQSGDRSGSKEVAADAQALLHAVADVQRRVNNFLLDTQRSSAQVEPRATDTAAEGEPGAERGSEKSLGAFAEKQSCFFSYPGTTIDMPPAPLRTEWDSVFSNPYSGAMSGDEEGIFCTPSCFAMLFWTKFQLFLRASLQGGKIMAQIVSTVTRHNSWCFSRWPSLPC